MGPQRDQGRRLRSRPPRVQGAPERGPAWLNRGQVRRGCRCMGCMLKLESGVQLLSDVHLIRRQDLWYATQEVCREVWSWLRLAGTGSSPGTVVLWRTPHLKAAHGSIAVCVSIDRPLRL